jgi:adenosylmethionine-8-amino-7-oxononanoate aminotransferase
MQDKIWYPFTQMKNAVAPIQIERGKNSLLFTTEGKKIIDAVSSWWVNIHGHSNPTITKAISDQAKKLEHVILSGFTHQPAKELAAHILELLPPVYHRVFFSDNGSTCVEVAIKMALQYWQNIGKPGKKLVIALEDAYHGDTFGAMSVGARSVFNQAFNELLFEVIHIPAPNSDNIDVVLKQAKSLLIKKKVGAFIFEPLVQGAGGMKMYEAGPLDRLLKLFNENEVICIADEVMTGFGRTGKNFALQFLNVQPDIVCLSKGITGGFLPLGLTICSRKVFGAFHSEDNNKTLFHGHSYTGNPLSCAAANASLKLLTSDTCKVNIQRIGAQHEKFMQLLKTLPSVRNVRQRGTILAFDLNTTHKSSYFNKAGKDAYRFFIERGILLRPLGNVLYLMPPYCTTDKQLHYIQQQITEYLTYH